MTNASAFALPFALAVATLSPALSQAAKAPMPPQAASAARSGAEIAPAEGIRDHDVGIEGYAARTCVPIYSSEVSSVGPVLGDEEKDTAGRTVLGTECR